MLIYELDWTNDQQILLRLPLVRALSAIDDRFYTDERLSVINKRLGLRKHCLKFQASILDL